MSSVWWSRFVGLVKCAFGIMVAQFGVGATVTLVVALLLAEDYEELWERVRGDFHEAMCKLARERAGLELLPDDPISDVSFAGALSARSGIHISTVMDAEVLKQDLSNHAAGLIKEHTGVTLTNLLSVEQIKLDVVDHAETLVFDRTGLDVRGGLNFDDIQKKISEAVEKRLAELVVDRLRKAAEGFANVDATMDELLAMVYRAQEAKGIKVRDVALGGAASLLAAAYARISTPLKRRVDAFRQRAQNREAQRRFRQRHGLRMRYEKLPKGG